MANLTYSTQALDNLKHFHRKQHVIYVEGQDDVPFWSEVLKFFKLENFVIKIAGGDEEVEKYAKSIIDFDTDIIVARDCDYSDILQTQYNHRRILYTYGYAIENTLYRANSIAAAIATYARLEKSEELLNEAQAWLDKLGEKFKTMVVLDIANTLYDKGIKVIPNSCHKYIKKPLEICETTIHDDCSKVKDHIEDEELEYCVNLLNTTEKHLFFRIRGHFIANAILTYIESYVRNVRSSFRLSVENLYAFMMAELLKESEEEVDIQYLGCQVNLLKSSAA
jgi:hypothetical protein